MLRAWGDPARWWEAREATGGDAGPPAGYDAGDPQPEADMTDDDGPIDKRAAARQALGGCLWDILKAVVVVVLVTLFFRGCLGWKGGLLWGDDWLFR